ncbi:DedA family protein [Intrasporangium sp.]|uniref:DedA family protein n=1 Tax=Intrasporangium sp. TaxID=1925024 RepID=UPI003221E970
MSSFLDSLVQDILGQPAWLVYVVVGLVVFLEDAIFVGFVLPGETVAILGGVAASLGHVDLPVVFAVVIAAAIVGDSVGFEVGRHLGPRVLTLRPLRKHRARLGRAQDLLARRGGVAVFLARSVAFFRAVMPALAGMSGMRYRTFLAWNAAGGITWGATVVSLGYVAGSSYARVEEWFGRATAAVIALVVVAAVVAWSVHHHHAGRGGDEASSAGRSDPAPGPDAGRTGRADRAGGADHDTKGR